MATRTALLNGNVINRDTDFSKHIEAVSEPWVISWFAVSSSSVAVWQALVKCERTNGDIIYAVVYNNSAQEISWNGDVFIEIAQELIDNGELMNEDWTGIAEIKVGTMPSKNALKLATKNWNTITDARNMIKKVWELNNDIQSLDSRMDNAEQEIDELIANSVPEALEETWLVWEKYTLSDTIFKQKTPKLENSTNDWNIWDINSNKEIHIQRIASWTASNQLKLKVKKTWAPTTWLVIEVRKWTKVDVSGTEAYWYWWWSLIASWSINYSDISTDYDEKTVTLNANFWWTRWELLDIVVYQTWKIVNSTNYYSIACDWTQYSEWFSLVAVNWDTRTRSKYMPYCVWEWFESSLLCKTATAWSGTSSSISFSVDSPRNTSWQNTTTVSQTLTQWYSTLYVVVNYITSQWLAYYWTWGSIVISVNWTQVWSITDISKGTSGTKTFKLTNVSSWAVISALVTSTWYSWQWGSYMAVNLSWTMNITATQSWVVRPLIPKEIKDIWQQTTGMSYGRKPNGTWYGEFDSTVYNSASTWSITLWNCIWFKVITDANWDQYKVPIYWM